MPLASSKLQKRLVAGYVGIGVVVSVLGLAGGRIIQNRATDALLARVELTQREAAIESEANAAAEETFSYVLMGDPAERAAAEARLASLGSSLADLGDVRLTTQAEGTPLSRARADFGRLRDASRRMFDEYAQRVVVERETYDAYESAVDTLRDDLQGFRQALGAQAETERRASTRTINLWATLLAIAISMCAWRVGVAFGRRITRPIMALRRAMLAYGDGDRDLAMPPRSADEVGDLADAFTGMAAAIRQQIEALEAGEGLLRDIFASIGETLVVSDSQGIVVGVNAACCRLTGHTEAEILGQSVTMLLPQFATTHGIAAWHGETSLRLASGCGCAVRLSVTRLHGSEREGWVWVAEDISERHKLESQLRQAQKMEAVGRLAGGVAHDFNNMLSIVLGYTEMLIEERPAGDPMLELLTEIQRAAERSADLTHQLLAFSRQQVLETKVVDLNGVVDGTAKMIRRVLGEDVDVRVNTHPHACKTKVAPGQIEQVLMNLVVNARDAMPAGGTLTVETSLTEFDEAYAAQHAIEAGRYVLLAVTDTGTGMDKETQARIFEPFFTTKEQGKGTGLGLSTVFGIVQQSGGHIFVDSEIGHGSTFKLYFPEASPPSRGVTSLAPREARAVHVAATILLVEDEEQVRNLAHLILRRDGYNVLVARDPNEALLLSRTMREPIDLLLTDVIMPHMSGPEVARQVLATHPETRVVYMSGYTDNVVLHHDLGDDCVFLQKPISPTPLSKTVASVLRSSSNDDRAAADPWGAIA